MNDNTDSMPYSSLDFQCLFESAPGLYLILSPDEQFKIIAVNEAYLKATMTTREAIIGKGLFEVFPDNPNDIHATGERNLRASLMRVLQNQKVDAMPMQKYDIRRPESEGGSFEERFWSPINKPVFDRNQQMMAIIHRVEDVTEYVHLKQKRDEQEKYEKGLLSRLEKMEADIFLRNKEHETIQTENNELQNEIIERKRTEAFLRESEQRYRILATATHSVVWTTDSLGAFITPQPSWEAFTGQTWEEYKDFGWISALHLSDRELLLQAWQQAVKTGTVYQAASRIWSQQVQAYHYTIIRAAPLYDEYGDIQEWIGTCLDIHQLKETEEKLRTAKEYLNLTLKTAQIGIWDWEEGAAQVVWDEQMYGLFGLDPTTFVMPAKPEEIMELAHPDDRAEAKARFRQALEGNGGIYCNEYRVIWPDQTVHYLVSRGNIARDSEGKVIKLVGVVWDITLQKQYEQSQLQALQQQAEYEKRRAQEAEAYKKRLEEFIDTICHELRNPLNGIYGSLDMLTQKLGLFETILQSGAPQIEPYYDKLNNDFLQVKSFLQSIAQCAHQQKVIVDDVLDLSKLDAKKVELNNTPFNPKQLIQAIVNMFSPQITLKKLKLSLELSEADIWVKGDSNRLAQILSNLLANAIKFTHEGSIIIKNKFLLGESKEKTILNFTIQDTGVGMLPEELNGLFNRFAQANRLVSKNYGGSGLGLSITKALIDLMQGKIDVESERWKGTKVIFSVMCTNLSEQEKLSLLETQSKKRTVDEITFMPKSKKNILIVEDNLLNQKILTHYLENAGYICQTADNGQEAVRLCQELHFDLILMDIEMPIMNGLEATQAIRRLEQKQNPIPIIGLSGNARSEQRQTAMSVGMTSYLTKPVHKDELYNELDTWLFTPQKTAKIKLESTSSPNLNPHNSEQRTNVNNISSFSLK